MSFISFFDAGMARLNRRQFPRSLIKVWKRCQAILCVLKDLLCCRSSVSHFCGLEIRLYIAAFRHEFTTCLPHKWTWTLLELLVLFWANWFMIFFQLLIVWKKNPGLRAKDEGGTVTFVFVKLKLCFYVWQIFFVLLFCVILSFYYNCFRKAVLFRILEMTLLELFLLA